MSNVALNLAPFGRCTIKPRCTGWLYVEDARIVRDFLVKQIGFEVDPYGINTLKA